MKHFRRSRRSGRGDVVARPDAGETLDSLDSRSRSTNKTSHKDLQLCRQAYRTLSLTLVGGCGDAVLAGLVVRAVLPAPDAGRLLVCLEPSFGPGADIDVLDVLARLDRVRPMLRREVAAALVRKRAPELEFVVMPRQEVWP